MQHSALTIATPRGRKSAWSVFTAWLGASFASDDSDSGDADSVRRGKGSSQRKRVKTPGSYTNGFSPSSGSNTSPSPVRNTAQQQHLTSSARPAFVRASTLRTIDEGDSPHGSYISSSVPSLRHIAALTGVSPTAAGSLEGIQSGSGIVARRSVSGSNSRRGSAELGMLMIEDRKDAGGEKGAGKGKGRAFEHEGVDGMPSGSSVVRGRSRSRSRSRSPLTTQHRTTTGSAKNRPTAQSTPETIDADDPDDPFNTSNIPPTRTPREDGQSPDERTPLIVSSKSSTSGPNPSSSHRSTHSSAVDDPPPPDPWYRGPLFEAGWKLSVLFAVFTIIMVGGIYLGLPKVDPEDKPALKLPRSFADLQALNGLFQKYKDRYPFRVLIVGCASYLYVQAFILPGSMYISILFGAAYGVLIGVFLSCICEATGALLNYALSAVVGPPLLTIESYRNRLELWRVKIMGDAEKGEQVGWDGVFSFLIVLRIAPFPPHWVANIVAPHLGISPLLFWSACFIGIAPVSVIHTTIGSGLDSMTSAEDFHILSLRNVLGLLGIAVAVMIPTGLKRFFKKDLSGLSEAEAALHNPDIHIQTASLNGEEASVTGSRKGYGDPYYASDAISYQAQDSGVVLSPPAGYGSMGDGYYYGSVKKGKGRAMDLEEALSVIENEEDHEVLAVVYEGDAEADSIIEEFASSALHQDNESSSGTEDSSEEDVEGKEFGFDSVASLGSAHRGYGTIPHGDVEQGGRGSPRSGDGKQWWEVWKR